MKAIVYTKYGAPDVLQLKEVEKPVPKDYEVLIRVHATTVNRTDCATIRAKPFFMRIVTGLFKPKKQIPGTEFAGEIEAVGKNVAPLKVGDKVFGFDDQGSGAHAQYMTIKEDKVITIPDNISSEQAAASSEGAHYAYNFINKVDLKKGQTVLVNRATGAIGSAEVQLLKYFEFNVTAVCATKNIKLVKSQCQYPKRYSIYKIPIYFFEGKYDKATPTVLVENFYKHLVEHRFSNQKV